MLDDTTSESSKFRTRNWVETNDESRGSYNVSNQIKFKTSMIKSNFYDYSDAYVRVKVIITVPNTSAQGEASKYRNKKVIFKNSTPFANCLSEIWNKQVDDVLDIDVVMRMNNLIEYIDIHSKTLGNIW